MKSSASLYRQIAWYGLPILFCLALHQLALKTWFFQDDFAWLALRLDINSPADLWNALFSPKAQGTIRTLSERLYFLVFSSLFGLNIVPFKIWTMLTQFANIVLLMQIARRLTGSAAAAFLAAILWIANAGLALALSWSSAYNEIAFAFVTLLAFRLFLLYLDTGQRKYWIWQWIVFLLGFLVLELNVTYPALAAGYALCCVRRYFRQTLYLFIPSLLFIAAHFAFIPPSTDPHYQMHYASSLGMLWTYLSYALGGLRDSQADWRPLWLGYSVAIAAGLALAAFAAAKFRRRDWLPLFLFGWFLAVISPVLPLRDHFTEYYVLVPGIGLAILGGWALAGVRGFTAPAAAVLAALYFTVSIADLHMTEKFFYNRARRAKYLVLVLEALPKTETSKTILIEDVDNDLFWSAISDDPFRLLKLDRVYLTPGAEARIDPASGAGIISRFTITFDDVVARLREHQLLVVRPDGRRLLDVTQPYLATVSTKYVALHPGFVDVADPIFQASLGPTWYLPEKDYRWMPKTATVKIAAPQHSGQRLSITGYCPASVLAVGPLAVSFRADGTPLGTATLRNPDQPFELSFPAPSKLAGSSMMEVEIEVSRTTRIPGDQRPLGLVFGTFTMK